MIQGAARRWVVLPAIAFYIAATLLWALPLVSSLGSRLPVDDGDPLFNTWVIAWNDHSLTRDPAGLFNANIFYPNNSSLAYSDLMLPPSLAALPITLITGNPLVAYNFLVIISFIFSALAMFLLVRLLTQSDGAAFVAGAAYAFSTYRVGQLGHIQLLTDGFLVFMIFWLHRYLVSRRGRDLALAGLFLSLQALSSWYYGFYAALLMGGFLTFFAAVKVIPFGRRSLAAIGLTVAGIAALVGPFAAPYIWLRSTMPDFGRTLGEAVYFSASGRDYLATQNPVLRALLGPFLAPASGSIWEHLLWPGFFAVGLALVAGLIAIRRGDKADEGVVPRSKIMLFYVLLGIGAMFLSLGPYVKGGHKWIPMPYLLAWSLVPGFKAMRVPARLGLLVILSLVVLAGFGWRELGRIYGDRVRLSPLTKYSLGAVLAVVVIGTQVTWPFPLSPPIPVGSRVPPVYDWLAKQPGDTVFEFPSVDVKDGAVVGRLTADVRYEYFSTRHWKTLVNGYSGYTPPEYSQVIEAMGGFPDTESVTVLRRLGVDYLIYHTAGDREAALLLKKARLQNGLKPGVLFGADVVFGVRRVKNELPGKVAVSPLLGPAGAPVGEPVNVAWRLKNTTGNYVVVGAKDQPTAEYRWGTGPTRPAWPRLPLVMKPGGEAWMHAQVDGPTAAGAKTLEFKLRSPFTGEAVRTLNVRGVAGMPLSVDGSGLSGRYTRAEAGSRVASGSVLTVRVKVKNNGRALWRVRFDPNRGLEAPFDRGEIRLAAFWLDKQGKQLGEPRLFRPAHDVGPGQSYGDALRVSAPEKPGRYRLKLDVVALGIAWFKDLGMKTPTLDVNVD